MRKELKLAAAATLACALLFGLNVHADNARAVTGAKLTYLVNGSPVFLGAVSAYDAGFADNQSTNGGAGYTAFNISNTAFVMVQCNGQAFVAARPVSNTDAGTTANNSLRIDTSEKFLVGMLQDGMPRVAISPTDAGSVQCKVFELK